MKVVKTAVEAHLDADDVKTLLTGRPWKVQSLHGAEGQVQVTYQIPPEILRAVGKEVVTSLQKLVKSNGHAPLLLPGSESRPRVTKMSGDCPYCEVKDLKSLYGHVRTFHKGKSMLTGEDGLKCPRCSLRFPTKASLGIHTRHRHNGKP